MPNQPRLTRRTMAAGLVLGSTLLRVTATAAQPAWRPSRPIRMLVPYTPGGGADTTARLLAGPMGAALGQAIVVENRPGAGGSIGAAEVARARPDGLTLMCDASAHVVNPAVLRGLSFDYAAAFTPISQVTVIPMVVLVPAKARAATLAELVRDLKARPGQPYGSAGNATAPHMAAVLFLARAGAEATHVPYRGGSAALPDLISGNLAFAFGTVAYAVEMVRQGQARALGVTSRERLESLPDVPTVAEQGYPGYELNEWNGLYGPAGLPAPVVATVHAAAKQALADPQVKERLAALGAIGTGTDPEAFAGFLAEQRALMTQLVREHRVGPD